MGTDPLNFSAYQILRLRAIDLFPKEEGSVTVFRNLARKWHPDRNKDLDAARVFAHVSQLLNDAKKAWLTGTYPNTLSINKSTGTIHYPYLSAQKYELGELYICERHVIWATERTNDDLAKRWLETVKSYKFPSDAVRDKITPFIPRNSHTVANGDRAYTIVDRSSDYIRVADILAKKGPMDPRHVAWTMSRAYNLAGFLQYAGIAHLDISPESFFIEPSTHFGALLGGWFYSAPSGKKLIAAPARNAHLVKSEANLDLQVRLLGRRMLGAHSPVELRANKAIPDAMRHWLMGSPMTRVADAHNVWHKKVLIDSFGEHRFTPYDLTTKEIYS